MITLNQKFETRKHQFARSGKRKKHTLDDTLTEIKRYNLKHGTHLSYGQYKAMMREKV